MYKKLDIKSWARREHFEFFRKFEEPFFGLVADVDVTTAYARAKALGVSFFVYYTHRIAAAVNGIEEFSYRISGDEVLVYDRVDVSATLTREDNTFGFSLIEYHPDFDIFYKGARQEIARVRQTQGLFTRSFEVDNLIHFSAIPWFSFTSLSHARSFAFPDSCPKISVGKIKEVNGCKMMPVSLHVHHALMDGYHTGLFFELLQQKLDEKL
jgi:chloramphenicol O-acetyltransferase type A